MKVLVLSDIHANVTALEAVLADAGECDAVWCLGDITGYGPDPNECVERIRKLPNLTCLIGNHDTAVLDQIDLVDFNDEARYTVLWTTDIIRVENYSFLSHCSAQAILGDFTLAHASPRQPIWEYILDTYTAKLNFHHFETPFCLVGHTHLPTMFRQLGNHHIRLEIPQPNQHIHLDGRMIINPGSVGQPRDHNPLASYMIVTPEERAIQYHRVAYDIPSVQRRMVNVSLPERHIQRLSNGY